MPPERHDDVVYLDIANRKRPFGVNLLDVGLGWDRDQAVGNALRVFKREFDAFWGPRMEDAFRFALMALFEANEAICHVDPIAGASHSTQCSKFRDLLGHAAVSEQRAQADSDPAIKHWFSSYFDPLELRHRQEIINPVQTKVHKYAGSKVARRIVGQPRSTIDFRELIAQDKIVLINLHAFDVIEDTAALVGGTLLNLAARAVSSQSSLPPDQRRSVTMAVDEFHTIPGADYEQVFGELAKYGANMILATQTLARLDRLTEARSHARPARRGVLQPGRTVCVPHQCRRRRVPGRGARWRAEQAGPAGARALPVLCAPDRRSHRRATASIQRAAGPATRGRILQSRINWRRLPRSGTAAA